MATLQGKVALITGAGQGVGQGIAYALASEGVSIAVTGRTKSKLDTTVQEIEKRGGNLCAPDPRPLGYPGYLNDLSEEQLDNNLQEYKDICLSYPREGRGVEEHCVDTGLDDPQSKKMAKAQYDMVAVAEAVQMLDGVDTMVAKYSSQPSDALRNISVEPASTSSSGTSTSRATSLCTRPSWRQAC